MFSQAAIISGTRTRWLLRPEWLRCTPLTEGPSWHGTWPHLGGFYVPRHNFVFFNSMYLKNCEDCGATCQYIYNTVLRTAIACHKGMQRNFRTKRAYLDKTERPGHRNKHKFDSEEH